MFNPGDILLYQSQKFKFSNLIQELIRLCTGNKVIHVAMYLYKDNNKHYIIEALDNGIFIYAMDDIIDRKQFNLFAISRLKNMPENITNTEKYIGTPYGYLTIINLLLQHGKTRLFPNKKWSTWFKSKHGYICSELCQLIIEDLINIKFPKKANLVEPDDYLNYPWEVIEIKNLDSF